MINNTTSRNKRALLIGVNKYPNLPDYSQLRGCVNDVAAMRETLETSFHFPPENITVLCDEQATAKQIHEAMEKLYADCGPDDIVVFHYSGHGSQMPALGDKPRGYDESIMPYDSGRNNPAFPRQVTPCDIRDTEIQEWLARLTRKTVNVTLVFDSCHSGSITRMQDDSAGEGTRLRWVPPDPLAANGDTPLATHDSKVKGEPLGPSGWLPNSEKYVLLAACAAEQGAYELDAPGDIRHGAFTYFLTQEINNATENTYQDVWDMVAVKVNNRFQKQTPQLEGARNRRVFNVDDFTPMRYLLVTERRGDEVILAGGLIHGVTAGSRWAVYPHGTKAAGDHQPVGEIKILTVTSITATAVITNEQEPNAIVPAARAIDEVHVEPEARMPVYVARAPQGYEHLISQLRRSVEQSTVLTIAKKNIARVMISIDSTDAGAAGQSQPVWLVQDQSQAQVMDKYPVADDNSILRIRENLEAICRYDKVLELRNESSWLKGQVDFELRKKGVDGSWQPVADDAVFGDGESIAFRVTNRAQVPIHVSVLDLGLSKRIALLHPEASASEMLAAGRSSGGATDVETSGVLTVGERPEDEIELTFPEHVRFLKLSGKEIFKLCVTTDRHDLGFLRQSGMRMDRTLRSGLEELIYAAMGTNGTREAAHKSGPRDEWLTIERSFWLKKK